MRLKLAAIMCAVVVAVAHAAFGQSAMELLRKAGRAPDSVSFKGTKTATFHYGGRQVTSTAQVFHKAPDKTRIQFLSPKELAGVVLIENGCAAWEFSPRDGAWKSIGALPMIHQDKVRPDLLETHTLRHEGTAKMAGRTADLVTIRQKSGSQPSRTLWLDKTHSVVVASKTTDADGQLRSSSQFSRIAFFPKDIDSVDFEPSGKISGNSRQCSGCENPVFPKHVPEGYKKISGGGISVAGRDCTATHYSNGISSFTLFQRKCGETCDMKFLKNKVTRALAWSTGDRAFTLVGDLSEAEMKRVAESIGD